MLLVIIYEYHILYEYNYLYEYINIYIFKQQINQYVLFSFLIPVSPSFYYLSQAVLVDRTMYIAGQLGMDPSSGQLVPGGAKEQTHQVKCDLTYSTSKSNITIIAGHIVSKVFRLDLVCGISR